MAFQRLADLATAVEALAAAAGAAGAPTLKAARLRLGGPAVFRALRLLRAGPPGARPQLLLVGDLTASGRPLELRPGLAPPLDDLALVFEPGAAPPSLRCALWAQLPPNPNKARLADWPPDALAAAPRVELYRQRIPGPEPDATIASEPAPLPSTLVAGQVTLELPADGALAAFRTTILDRFGSTVAIMQRVTPRA